MSTRQTLWQDPTGMPHLYQEITDPDNAYLENVMVDRAGRPLAGRVILTFSRAMWDAMRCVELPSQLDC